MNHARLDSHRPKGAHPTATQDRILGKTRVPIADVEAGRDEAIDRMVVGSIRIEQEERHAAEVNAPDLDFHRAAVNRNRDRERLVLSVAYKRCGETLDFRRPPVLDLPTLGIKTLVKVALAIEETHRHE